MATTIERMIGLLPGYLQDGKNINKIFNGLAKQFDELYNAMLTTALYRDLDKAKGYSLDITGDIIGEKRQGREDSPYRLSLKTKVISNRSSGDIETVNEYARAILGEFYVGIFERNNMNLNLRYTFNPYSSKDILVNMVKKSVAAGISIDTSLDIQVPVTGAFTLGEIPLVLQMTTIS